MSRLDGACNERERGREREEVYNQLEMNSAKIGSNNTISCYKLDQPLNKFTNFLNKSCDFDYSGNIQCLQYPCI